MKQKLERLLRAHPPIRFAADVVDVYFSKKVGRAAAELAYFLILTFFPILICISAFVNELHLDPAHLLDQADPFLPAGVLAIFRDYLTYIDTNQSTAMLLSGAFLTILFASAAVRGLMNIMQELYGRATFLGLGQVAARTGGLASSYAGSAAQQTYDGYMSALADKVPELRQLALRCAPLLAGLKCANLLILRKGQSCRIRHFVIHTNISGYLFYQSKEQEFLLLYRAGELEAHLSQPEAGRILGRMGYPDQSLCGLLDTFGKRYRAYRMGQGSFPHEMGLFLGYPPEDVQGLM